MCDVCGTSLLNNLQMSKLRVIINATSNIYLKNHHHIMYKKYEISFINNVMTIF
jgi:hypothetical protein